MEICYQHNTQAQGQHIQMLLERVGGISRV